MFEDEYDFDDYEDLADEIMSTAKDAAKSKIAEPVGIQQDVPSIAVPSKSEKVEAANTDSKSTPKEEKKKSDNTDSKSTPKEEKKKSAIGLTLSINPAETPSEDGAGAVIGSILSAEPGDARLNIAYARLGIGDALREEDWGIWRVISGMKQSNFVPDQEFIVAYLNRHKELVKKADRQGFVNLKNYQPVNGDDVLGYITAVAERYKSIKERYESQTEEEFKNALNLYLEQFMSSQTEDILNQAIEINIDGAKVNGRYRQGSESAYAFVKERMSRLESTVSTNEGLGFKTMRELFHEIQDNETIKPRLVCDWPGIPTLNKVTGGITTSNLITILAPPKNGKTKFCSRICHSALMERKNVTVWPVESGPISWMAQQRAIHFNYIRNASKSPGDKDYIAGVTQDAIAKDFLTSPNGDSLRKSELLTAQDLVDTGDYGVLDFVDGDFRVDTFLDKLAISVERNNSDLVIIDYMQLISGTGNSPQWEVIAEAYKELLKFSVSRNIAVISPAQLNQDAIRGLQTNSDGSNDLRTAGGNSSEIVRSSDLVFSLWASRDDLANNRMKIIPVPSRKIQVFDPIDMHINLAYCDFNEAVVQ